MKKSNKYLSISVVLFLLLGCGDLENSLENRFVYQPLHEYHYTPINIQAGTQLKVFGFSGGRENDKGNINYYQFLVTNPSTGDTIRILTSYISVNDSSDKVGDVLTNATMYNINKGVTIAYYQMTDTTAQNIAFQTETQIHGHEMDTNSYNNILNHPNAKEWVVVNTAFPIFQNPKYKTAFGTLNFKTIPW
jgi:hypothetical protein